MRLVSVQFEKIKKRLSNCALSVSAHREVINMLRTLESENQWMTQKQIQLSCDMTMASLLEVRKLLIRHQNLTNEVGHRKARNLPLIKPTDEKTSCAVVLATHQHLKKDLFVKISKLVFQQAVVDREIGVRCALLHHWQAYFVQQMDLLELYNWLTETESTVMIECHAARGLASAHAAIKQHLAVEFVVSEFQAPRLRQLIITFECLQTSLFMIAGMTGYECFYDNVEVKRFGSPFETIQMRCCLPEQETSLVVNV
ncbi:unnamed protein product [Hydatigera taeniaeformis]|uniref:Uncharacterized protein n=1 Tax=Hydatigena taeniaeformis TaxID=6205 RepID=A0A3P7EHM5_HYDTA|nr:unnamed protein product [Hydatigera taeniaeformis]